MDLQKLRLPGNLRADLLIGGLIFLVASLWPILVGSGSPSMMTVLGTAVGLGLIAYGFLPAVSRLRIEAPEMSVSSTRLRVGDEFSMSYRQTWKRATDVNRIGFQLVLRETVRYTSGTETVTDVHDDVVQQFESQGRHFGVGEMIDDHFTFRIPETGMHTFIPSQDNRIEWFVKVTVEMASWPDFTWEHELTVLPEMVS